MTTDPSLRGGESDSSAFGGLPRVCALAGGSDKSVVVTVERLDGRRERMGRCLEPRIWNDKSKTCWLPVKQNVASNMKQ